jgi:hypothetical protein
MSDLRNDPVISRVKVLMSSETTGELSADEDYRAHAVFIRVLASIDAAGARRPTKPHKRILMGIAAAVVLAVGVGGGLLAAESGPSRLGRVASRLPDSAVPTKARLVAKVSAALESVSGEILYIDTVSANGWSYDTWLSPDGNTMRVTSYDNGAVNNDLTYTVSGSTFSATVVDYADHAWWSYTAAVPTTPEPNCTLPACGDQANGGLAPGPDVDGVPASTAGMRWLLSSGHFTVENGTQTVDGVHTYEMTESRADGSTFSLWINQATDLPVQVQSSGSSNPGNNSTSQVSWLAPTGTNLRALQVAIPAEFTHSPMPIAPPVPAGGGVG